MNENFKKTTKKLESQKKYSLASQRSQEAYKINSPQMFMENKENQKNEFKYILN